MKPLPPAPIIQVAERAVPPAVRVTLCRDGLRAMTRAHKWTFVAGLLAAVVCMWLIASQPLPWPHGKTAGIVVPSLVPRLQRLLVQQGEELEYAIGLNGVAAATLRTSIHTGPAEDGQQLVMEYEIRPVATFDKVWSFRQSAKTVMSPRTLLPSVSETVRRSGERVKTMATHFDHQSGIATVTIRKSDRDEPKLKEVPFDLGLDVPSAFLWMRVMKLPLNEVKSLTLLNGDDTYEVVFEALATGEVEVPAGRFDAIEVDVHIRKLEENTVASGEGEDEGLTPAPEHRNVRVWLSKDRRVPLKIDCQVLIGHIHAELLAAKPAPAPL